MVTIRGMPDSYDVVVYTDDRGNYYAEDRYGNVVCKNSRTACIEDAVNYVGGRGGGKVYIKKGVYKSYKWIGVLVNNVEIFGDGMGRTVIELYDTLSPVIYIGRDNQTSIIVRNVYIHDLTLDAKYQYDPNNPQGNGNSTLWAYYVSDLMLERIEHKNAYWRTSITLGSVGCNGQCIQENIVIRGNVFRGVALTLGGIQNLVLEDNIFYGTASSPDFNTIIDFSFGEYQDSYIYNATVRGNIFYKVYRNPDNRVGWVGVAAGFQRIVGAVWEGNVFIDPDDTAIYVLNIVAPETTLDLRGIEFIGNTIIGLGKTVHGIVVKHGKAVIEGNYIENTTDVAISVSEAEAVIEGNYIVETPTAGIWVSNGRATIVSNVLRECAKSSYDCIVVDGTSAYCTIVGNRMYRSITTYLPSAVNTLNSNGYNVILGNIAEGKWSTTKYKTSTTDVVTGNI